jgi:putative tryptophan/tyrosine transport system substrate-binding protein
MRRRKFITLLGGAASLPLTARAQQPERVRRIGVLIPFSENDPEVQARLAAFKQRLQDLGWTDGRNVRIDYRFTGENTERIRIGAAELVAVAPDVIVVYANTAVAVLRQATRVIPIVLYKCPIRSGVALSRAWRVRVEISPGFTILKPRSAGNGWRCSRRSRLGCVG